MKISGYISDNYGKTDGASIQLYRDGEGTTLGVVSNQDGYFEINNKDIKQNDVFKIAFIGYKSVFKEAKDLKDANIFLEENVEQLGEFVVTAKMGKKPEIKPNVQVKNWRNNSKLLLVLSGIIVTASLIFIVKKIKWTKI